jgi:hypothetical protein
MSKALVTFTPLEPYLFGGEQGFGSGEGQNYYAKGNPLPQQSTLCGTLRHLLHKNGYRRGLHSFDPGKNDPDHGELLGISPLFLTDGTKYYLRQAIDRHNEGNPFALAPSDKAQLLLDTGDLEQSATWEQRRAWDGMQKKKSKADYWITVDGCTVNTSEIFHTTTRPGIPKRELHEQQRTQTTGPGLHKKDLWHIKKGWSFAAIVNFHSNVNLDKIANYTLPMGAEKVVFSIQVKRLGQTLEELFPKNKMFYPTTPTEPRMVLLSDTYMPDDVWPLVETGVTDTVDFRNIETVLSDEYQPDEFSYGPLATWTHNTNKPKRKDGLHKGQKYTLLERGSVLVFKNDADMQQAENILKNTPWYTIGYNHVYTYSQK